MKHIALALLFFSVGAYGNCKYNEKGILDLDLKSFDQDLNGGWRSIAKKDGCKSVAADIIEEYRNKNNPNNETLYWHEGQLRASLGQTSRAIKLFEKSKKPEYKDITGWNYYVEANISFLKNDLESLRKNRELLAAIEKPQELIVTDENGNLVDIPWPPNLNVVDGLLNCFNETYSKAYQGCQ